MECLHLLDNVKVISDLKDVNVTKNFECSECGVKEQTWVCLSCGVVNCGRYMSGHAKFHADLNDHYICMSSDVFSVYCYKCDDYISNDTEDRLIHKIRQSIMKCRPENGTNIIDIERSEETSKDGSEGMSSSVSTSSLAPAVELMIPSPILIEDNSKDEEIASNHELVMCSVTIESCESKLIKNKITVNAEFVVITSSCMRPSSEKAYDREQTNRMSDPSNTEENPRSLRPRSRKRSHSEDSLSADSQSSRFKEKKIIPCNGKSQREKKVVGLKNLGNTCFMNAVLQSLSNIQEFSCYFNSLPSLEVKGNGRKVYHSRSITRQEMQELVMAEELRKVLINLNKGGCGTKAISPECLFHVIWKVVPRFRGYQQQDAHEFLRYMLDRLHQELLQLLPQEGKDSSYVTALRTGSASIVTAVFGGTLQSEVRCLACGADSKKFDPFLDLSLELPEVPRADISVTLDDCLASFVQVEELADTERYFCSSCKCKQKSTKQFWIRRLPNVLCLHLKRFRWHNYFRTKVDTNIEFPVTSLDMSQFVLSNVPDTRRSGGSHLYDLAAVIVHHGSGAGSGHYTAFAINEDQWFHFNDQTVRATDEATVAACKPYILFYIRRELSLPVTTPS